MQRIPLHAHAECTDGPCGDLAGVVVKADTRGVEYYVVRDNTPGHAIERLVPRLRVDPSAMHIVHLDCTLSEFEKMQPLNVQELVDPSAGKQGGTVYGHAGRYGVMDAERAPDGTGVLRETQRVEATDGVIGTLTGIAIDDTAQITHFYTQLSGRGSPELCLPVSALSYVDRYTVYLRLDKHQVGSLPAVARGESVQLIATFYDAPHGASEALEQLRQAPIAIREAAVLVREGDSPPKVVDKQQSAQGTRKGAAMGIAAGGMLAALGPIGLVAGAVAGGAVGGLAGSRSGHQLPDTFLGGLEERLKPDQSALVVLIEHDAQQDSDQVRAVLEGAMSHTTLVDTLVQEMLVGQA